MTRRTELFELARAHMEAAGQGRLNLEFAQIPLNESGKITFAETKHFRLENGLHIPYKIIVNKRLADVISDRGMEALVKHEIAHAQAGYEAAHGPLWSAKAIALGIVPDEKTRLSTLVEEPEKMFL